MVLQHDDEERERIVSTLLRTRQEPIVVANSTDAWDLYVHFQFEFPLVIASTKSSGEELCERVRRAPRDGYCYFVLTGAHPKDVRHFADARFVTPTELELELCCKVAARVARVIDARVEATLRRAVQTAQDARSHDAAIVGALHELATYYQRRGAFARARAVLRRLLVSMRASGVDAQHVQDELDALGSFDDDASHEQARALIAGEGIG